jgi:hypothetical protein
MYCGYDRGSFYSNILTRYFVKGKQKNEMSRVTIFKHEINLNNE